MRGVGRLLALLFVVLLVVTGVVFYYQRLAAEANAPAPPAPLPENVAGTADRWQWSHTVGGKPIVEVSAQSYRMIQMPSRVELEDVELKIFGGDNTTYDLVKSRRADVDTRAKTMVSEGEVEILMQVPVSGEPMPEHPTVIRSSKVQFETETGIARTPERTHFVFADGFGEAVGAVYDPQTKQMVLESEAAFTFQKPDGSNAPSRVWAAHAVYLEAEGLLQLRGPTRLERNNLVLDAGDATITLQGGEVRRVDAAAVSGTDTYPDKTLRFGGERVELLYGDDGNLRELISNGASRLDSDSKTHSNQVRAARMHLYFASGNVENELEKVWAQGAARMESAPRGEAAAQQPKRVLESEIVELRMRPGGEDIQQLLTHAPGIVTFLPANAEQRQRVLHGERMTADYGERNRMRHFRATTVTTESAPSAVQVADARKRKEPDPAPLKTRSTDLEASFSQTSGQMDWMKQWGRFEFEEGARRGRAESALLHQKDKYNLLEGNARVWDPGGSLQARTIRTEEPSGDLTAEGDVVSTRKPDTKEPAGARTGSSPGPAAGAEVLPGGAEPMQATAQRMTTRDQNQWIRYEGNARLWQGASRLHADVAVIDRKQQTLSGDGNVFSQIEEAAATPETADDNADASGTRIHPGAAGATAKPRGKATPVYTLIHSDRMVYQEDKKLATYQGAVRMRRAGLSVDAQQMRMQLEQDKAGRTQLTQSFADGNVRILMREPANTRRGASQHAEYYPEETKMVLYGGDAFFEDQKQGATRGKRLTYFSRDDRLIVESGEATPAVSVIRRK
jgi:lipopolysaccharide export system protein LptA